MRSEYPSLLYGVQNTDITDFVYKLHALAGDYLRDAEYNLHALDNEACADFVVLMSDQSIRLEDAAFAYQKGMDLNQSLFTSEYRNERAFLLQVEHREVGRAYGDVLLLDCDTLRRDVSAHAISPVDVTATGKDGTEASMSFEKWASLELYEKDALQSWVYRFAPEDRKALGQHQSEFFAHWMGRADMMKSSDLLLRLNTHYMMGAQNPQWDMYRIPQETARQMLLNNDAPVHRLLPGGAEQLQPIAAVKTGLWYSSCCEFAVKPEDLPGLDRACKRQTERIMGRVLKHAVPERPRPTQER